MHILIFPAAQQLNRELLFGGVYLVTGGLSGNLAIKFPSEVFRYCSKVAVLTFSYISGGSLDGVSCNLYTKKSTSFKEFFCVRAKAWNILAQKLRVSQTVKSFSIFSAYKDCLNLFFTASSSFLYSINFDLFYCHCCENYNANSNSNSDSISIGPLEGFRNFVIGISNSFIFIIVGWFWTFSLFRSFKVYF